MKSICPGGRAGGREDGWRLCLVASRTGHHGDQAHPPGTGCNGTCMQHALDREATGKEGSDPRTRGCATRRREEVQSKRRSIPKDLRHIAQRKLLWAGRVQPKRRTPAAERSVPARTRSSDLVPHPALCTTSSHGKRKVEVALSDEACTHRRACVQFSGACRLGGADVRVDVSPRGRSARACLWQAPGTERNSV